MVEVKESNSQQITLEKLLHVKRDERPEREFWDRFEREDAAYKDAVLPHGVRRAVIEIGV